MTRWTRNGTPVRPEGMRVGDILTFNHPDLGADYRLTAVEDGPGDGETTYEFEPVVLVAAKKCLTHLVTGPWQPWEPPPKTRAAA